MTTRPMILSLALALIAGCLVGCNSGARIEGRVLAGSVSRAIVVSTEDDRLESTGIAGVSIQAMVRVDGAMTVIGEGTSDASGAFDFPLRKSNMPGARVRIEATPDGYIPVKNEVFVPSSDQRVIIVLDPIGGE